MLAASLIGHAGVDRCRGDHRLQRTPQQRKSPEPLTGLTLVGCPELGSTKRRIPEGRCEAFNTAALTGIAVEPFCVVSGGRCVHAFGDATTSRRLSVSKEQRT